MAGRSHRFTVSSWLNGLFRVVPEALDIARHTALLLLTFLERRIRSMAIQRASEELLAAPLPDFVRNLGLAVAQANAELRKQDTDIIYTIPEVDIEIKVAISVSTEKVQGVEAKVGFQAFALSASYKSTFGFSEEASSSIRMKLQAVPRAPTE